MRIALVVTMLLGVCGCGAPLPDEVGPPDAAVHDAGNAKPYQCGLGTCNGCCDGNRCVAGTFENACGNSGALCAVCGVNALCGVSRTCEEQDPDRYGVAPDGGNRRQGGNQQPAGDKCGWLGGSWICW